MNKNNLVKIIGRELSILTDFVSGFSDSENIHPMEVDLALSKAKDIYNELLLLKGEERDLDVPEPKFDVVPKVIVESIKEPIKPITELPMVTKELLNKAPQSVAEEIEIDKPVLESTNQFSHVADVQEPIALEKPIELYENEKPNVEPDQSEQIELINTIIEPEKKTEHSVEPIPVAKLPEGILEIKPKKGVQKGNVKEVNIKSEIIADKFPKESFSLNDRLAGFKDKNDLASLLKGTPITDLKKAIKLNDRVWFTNELFNKNGATFERAVDAINKSADLDSALKYLVDNYTWNQELPSTVSFLELVFRRFPSK